MPDSCLERRPSWRLRVENGSKVCWHFRVLRNLWSRLNYVSFVMIWNVLELYYFLLCLTTRFALCWCVSVINLILLGIFNYMFICLYWFLQFLLEDARSNEAVPKPPIKSHIPSAPDASADTTVTLPLRRPSPKEIDDKGDFFKFTWLLKDVIGASYIYKYWM